MSIILVRVSRPFLHEFYSDHGFGGNGRSVSALVQDICPGCGSGDISLSIEAFVEIVGPIGVGRVNVAWSFVK